MECITALSKDLGYKCGTAIVKGVEKDVLLVNRADLDKAGITVNENVITTLVLKSEKTAYLMKYAKDTHISVSTKPVISDDDLNGHEHSIVIVIYGKTKEENAEIDKLVAGGDLVAIVENKDQSGEGKHAFDVYGFRNGLVVSEGEGRTNGGYYKLTMKTPTGQTEPENVLKWLETDYATTKARFDKKLAQ